VAARQSRPWPAWPSSRERRPQFMVQGLSLHSRRVRRLIFSNVPSYWARPRLPRLGSRARQGLRERLARQPLGLPSSTRRRFSSRPLWCQGLPTRAGQLRGAIAPLGASAPSQIQPGPGNVLTMADGTTHVAPGLRQRAPGYGLNPYSYVAPHLMPARQPQPQQYPGYLSLRSPAPQGRPQFQGAAYLQGAAQPYPGMYGDDGGQGFPPPPSTHTHTHTQPTQGLLRRRTGSSSSSSNRRAARCSRFVWLPSHFPSREMR
jgi:hypothetical protein